MKEIKLIAFDMDGTTLNTQHQVSEKNIKALKMAQEHNIILVPASGRMVSLIPKEIFDIPGIRYVISSNGANIMDIQKQEIVYSNPIPYEAAEEIFRSLQPLNLYTEIYSGGKVYMDSDCLKRFRAAGLMQRYPEEFSANLYPVNNKLEYVEMNHLPIEKINIPFIEPDQVIEAGGKINTIEGIWLTTSGFDNLEINAEGTSKAGALKFLSDRLNIAPKNIMAIGDNLNDLEMIRFAGTGVAMGNASGQLKKAARYLTDDNDHDGVANAIFKYALQLQ